MSTLKRSVLISYLVGLHIVVLLAIALILGMRQRFQLETRLPGSRLSAVYDNRPDEWSRFIMHDGRDPVLSIVDRPFGVDHILVAPPGSQYVWSFDREGGGDWKLFVADYGTSKRADTHLADPVSNHVFSDGYPNGGIDGFPDREMVVIDGIKKVYTIEPKVLTLKYETPVSKEP